MNDKVIIDYKYLIGVSACLRQVDLSIDRCRWTSWNELRTFYKGRTEVEYYFDFFIEICQKLMLYPQYHELSGSAGRFNYLLSSVFGQKSFITTTELETGYYLLDEFNGLLRNEFPDPKYVEIIRLRMAGYYTGILFSKLRRKDINKVLKIEHYLQNESLATLPLSKIIAG
ncbi:MULTISPECIES: hypothetical protein [unclassified Chitinophaga]|uniref:hypothetical protein n=1 Tax=unclassified Chitinophaga TaxID=2619133 RepID=UPI00300F95DC